MTEGADDRAHRPEPEPGQDSETDVQPGDTPPAAGQMSAPQGHDEQGPRRATPWVWLVAIGLVVDRYVAMTRATQRLVVLTGG
ncbi:DUF6480 family protein [Isoptericola halotolerans]|uniref:DUF6480 family protein n=1 Tax=Isoptericola halotolerans TaxID=300560 RepID=UPI00388D1A05